MGPAECGFRQRRIFARRAAHRTGEKVVWTGDSGYELFGGAADYKADRTLTVMPYNNISGDYCQCAASKCAGARPAAASRAFAPTAHRGTVGGGSTRVVRRALSEQVHRVRACVLAARFLQCATINFCAGQRKRFTLVSLSPGLLLYLHLQ